jgi:Zn-dependent protease/CBS domain-containing protein
MHALKLGKVFGVEVLVDRSWIFIFLLLTWNLSSVFLTWHPTWPMFMVIEVALAATLVFFASLLLHEFAHSLTAKAFGVPVRNITLFMFGGVSQFEREPPSPWADFLISIVGPVASIGLGVLFATVFSVLTGGAESMLANPENVFAQLGPITTLLLWLGPINVMVGLFNMIPAFPLDGGRVLRAVLWGITRDQRQATRAAGFTGQAVAWCMIALGIAMIFGAHVPFFGGGMVSGIWLAFIGWFLLSAALRSVEQTRIEEMFEGVKVARIMRTRGTSIEPLMPLDALVRDVFVHSDERAVPLVHEGRFLGLISVDQVRAIPMDRWEAVTAAAIATGADRLPTAAPDDSVTSALMKLNDTSFRALPVVEGDRLVGLLFYADVARWIEFHRGRGTTMGAPRPSWQG